MLQPYVRLSPEEHLKKMQMLQAEEAKRKREDNESEGKTEGMSKNKLKKLAKQARNPKKLARMGREPPVTCTQCRNLPVSMIILLSN